MSEGGAQKMVMEKKWPRARLAVSLGLALGLVLVPAAALAQELDVPAEVPLAASGESGQELAASDGALDARTQMLKVHEDAVATKVALVADDIVQSVESYTGGDFDKWDLLRSAFHAIADTSTLDGYGLDDEAATLSALDGGRTTTTGATAAFRMLLAKLEIDYTEHGYATDGVEHLVTSIEIDGVWADVDIAQDIRERVESGASEAAEDEWTLEGNYGEAGEDGWEDVEWDLEDAEPLDPARYATWPKNYTWPDFPYCAPARSQERLGWCWAFANIAAVEASVLRHGLGNYSRDDIHLSERHLAYFTFNDRWDRLGNFSGYLLRPNKGDYISVGGAISFAANTLVGWTGPADDSVAPTSVATGSFYDAMPKNQTRYAQFLRDVRVDRNDVDNDAVHVCGVRIRHMDDRNAVKRQIMEDGAVVTTMYTNTSMEFPYYNRQSCAYYYGGTNTGAGGTAKVLEGTNHEVVIIGWDDNYETEHFNERARPKSPGAWLVRNSWGADWGIDGYFWVSYEDAVMNSRKNEAMSYKVEAADASDYLYQYDGSAYTASFKYSKEACMANVFTANSWGQGEVLDAVTFYEIAPPTDYEVYIYTDLKDPQNPESGTPALTDPLTGTTDAQGYFQVVLPERIYLKANSAFSVVIKLSKRDNGLVRLPVTGGYQRFSYWTYSQDIEGMQGVSFIKAPGSASYFDACGLDKIPSERWVLRIKAQTSRAKDIDIAGAEIAEIAEQAYTGEAIEPVPVVTFCGCELKEGRDYEVYYHDNVATGAATVEVSGIGAFTGALERTFRIVRAKGTVEAYDVTLAYGTGANVVTAVTPEAARLTFVSSDESVVTVDTDGALTPKGTGTAKVAVTADWGDEYERATAEALVTVTKGAACVKARSLTLVAGIAATINYEATSGAGVVSYESCDPQVASVASDGTVTPLRAGSTTITVRCAESELFEAAETTLLVTVTEATPGGQGGYAPCVPSVPSVPARPYVPSWRAPATTYAPGAYRPSHTYRTAYSAFGLYPYATRTTPYGIAGIIAAGPAFGTPVAQMPLTRAVALPASVERTQARVERTVGWWNVPETSSWAERAISPYLRLAQLGNRGLLR